jgi:hypothetical protein
MNKLQEYATWISPGCVHTHTLTVVSNNGRQGQQTHLKRLHITAWPEWSNTLTNAPVWMDGDWMRFIWWNPKWVQDKLVHFVIVLGHLGPSVMPENPKYANMCLFVMCACRFVLSFCLHMDVTTCNMIWYAFLGWWQAWKFFIHTHTHTHTHTHKKQPLENFKTKSAKMAPKVPDFEGNFFLKLPYLDNGF